MSVTSARHPFPPRGVNQLPSDTVAISVKVPESLRDRMDEVGEGLGTSGRSILAGRAVVLCVERHASIRVPRATSVIEEESREEVSAGRRRLANRKKRRFPVKRRRTARGRVRERRY